MDPDAITRFLLLSISILTKYVVTFFSHHHAVTVGMVAIVYHIIITATAAVITTDIRRAHDIDIHCIAMTIAL